MTEEEKERAIARAVYRLEEARRDVETHLQRVEESRKRLVEATLDTEKAALDLSVKREALLEAFREVQKLDLDNRIPPSLQPFYWSKTR